MRLKDLFENEFLNAQYKDSTEAIHHLKLKFTQNDDSDNSYA